MKDLKKYHGVIPAFYACYDEEGEISPERTRALVEYFIAKGVQGLYVNGSSGECIYLSVEDRKRVLEEVMKVAKGRLTIIAHVACNNTKRQRGVGSSCGKFGSRCYCGYSAEKKKNFISVARVFGCPILE